MTTRAYTLSDLERPTGRTGRAAHTLTKTGAKRYRRLERLTAPYRGYRPRARAAKHRFKNRGCVVFVNAYFGFYSLTGCAQL